MVSKAQVCDEYPFVRDTIVLILIMSSVASVLAVE